MLGSEDIERYIRATKKCKEENGGSLPPLVTKAIDIEPFRPEQLGPNSYNFRLAPTILIFHGPLDLAVDNEPDEIVHMNEKGFELQPNTLYLGSTVEWTQTIGFIPKIDGRSGSARKGLQVHLTAGFGDNGFTGDWTLEMVVPVALTVRPFFQIGQFNYTRLDGKSKPYNGSYQDQRGPRTSRIWKEADEALRQFRESLKQQT